MNRAVRLIAAREIAARTRSKAFRIGLLVTLVLIGVGVSLPALIGGDSTTRYDVGIGAGAPTGLRDQLTAQARARGAEVTFHGVDSTSAASTAVKDGDLDAAVVGTDLVVGSSSDDVVAVVQAASATATTTERLGELGLDSSQAAQALAVTPLAVREVESGESAQRQAVATVTIIFFFAQLITFCTWVGTGVVEEKTTRVVELLLGAVRPLQLLAGKIIGIGVVAISQAVLLGGTALVVAQAAGSLSLPASIYGTVAVSFVWFVLGFAFFATLAASLASLVSQQEEVGGVLTPMTLLLFIAYGGSFAAASDPDTTIARLASLVPPFSALAMPGRMARGGVPVWEVGLAMLLMLLATGALLLAGARIYRASILHTGTKLSLTAAWRAERVASGR